MDQNFFGITIIWTPDVSAAVTKDVVYTAGVNEEGLGFVIALTHPGEKIWQSTFGKEWMDSWDGTRSTPLVYNGEIYIMSSYGELDCKNAKDGVIIWNINLFEKFDGINIKWGVTENLLIDDNKLFITDGGIENNVIALNKKNGELIGTSKGKGEVSAYCSPMIVQLNDKKILVTQTTSSILGLVSIGKLVRYSIRQQY